MKVSKWGNSLAIRLPAKVVDALQLNEGDEIEIQIASNRKFEIRRDQVTENALERIRLLRRQLPVGFKFDRQDANER